MRSSIPIKVKRSANFILHPFAPTCSPPALLNPLLPIFSLLFTVNYSAWYFLWEWLSKMVGTLWVWRGTCAESVTKTIHLRWYVPNGLWYRQMPEYQVFTMYLGPLISLKVRHRVKEQYSASGNNGRTKTKKQRAIFLPNFG